MDKLNKNKIKNLITKAFGPNYGGSMSEVIIKRYMEDIPPWHGILGELFTKQDLVEYNYHQLEKPILEEDTNWLFKNSKPAMFDNESYKNISIEWGWHKQTGMFAFRLENSETIYLYSSNLGMLCHDGKIEKDVAKFIDSICEPDKSRKDFLDFIIYLAADALKRKI